ncbi:MAG: hypothetical protein ACPGQD_05585 [Planctomycetota bacterium]
MTGRTNSVSLTAEVWRTLSIEQQKSLEAAGIEQGQTVELEADPTPVFIMRHGGGGVGLIPQVVAGPTLRIKRPKASRKKGGSGGSS